MKGQTMSVLIDVTKFTPLEKEFLEVLKDGMPHLRDDLHSLIKPSSVGNITKIIQRMRVKLDPMGMDIVCVYRYRQISYQWIRRLGNQ